MSYLTSVHLYWFKVVDVRFHAIRLEFKLTAKNRKFGNARLVNVNGSWILSSHQARRQAENGYR
jgi:hypothetical protein